MPVKHQTLQVDDSYLTSVTASLLDTDRSTLERKKLSFLNRNQNHSSLVQFNNAKIARTARFAATSQMKRRRATPLDTGGKTTPEMTEQLKRLSQHQSVPLLKHYNYQMQTSSSLQSLIEEARAQADDCDKNSFGSLPQK